LQPILPFHSYRLQSIEELSTIFAGKMVEFKISSLVEQFTG